MWVGCDGSDKSHDIVAACSLEKPTSMSGMKTQKKSVSACNFEICVVQTFAQ